MLHSDKFRPQAQDKLKVEKLSSAAWVRANSASLPVLRGGRFSRSRIYTTENAWM